MFKPVVKIILLVLTLNSASACSDSANQKRNAALQDLTAHINDLFAQDAFSGEVLIGKNDDILLQYRNGFFDREFKQPLTGNEKFRLGSLNKMFTSVAILKLVDEGKVSLNATLDTYVPDFENKSISETVTVHHLLTHSGGTGDIFGPLYDQHRLELLTHDDYVALYQHREATQVAGKGFQYSDFGFILLGKIIENVSGQDYYSFVKHEIFQPAGMVDTGFEPEHTQVVNLTRGYTKQGDSWISNRDTLPYRGTAAGGGYSTVSDLFKFARALSNGTLIGATSLALATTKQVPMGDAAYGYGMGVFGEGALRFFGHNGGAPGMSAWLSIYPETGYTMIALSNYDQPIADNVIRFFTQQMPLE